MAPAGASVTEELDLAAAPAFVDDAGIVAFDDEYDVAFKVETHNTSALEPSVAPTPGWELFDVIGVSAA